MHTYKYMRTVRWLLVNVFARILCKSYKQYISVWLLCYIKSEQLAALFAISTLLPSCSFFFICLCCLYKHTCMHTYITHPLDRFVSVFFLLFLYSALMMQLKMYKYDKFHAWQNNNNNIHVINEICDNPHLMDATLNGLCAHTHTTQHTLHTIFFPK